MPLESHEGSSKDSLNEQIAALEAQLADLKKQLEATREASATSESAVDTGSSATWASWSGSWPEYTVQSVAPSEVDGLRLYKWGRESITKAQVLEIVNGLKEPYNTEVSDFIKQNNIKWLQKYLNSKIDSWEIDLAGLRDALTRKGIWLEGGNHIREDNKFWPQTLETIRFFAKEQPINPDPTPEPDPKPDPENPDEDVEKEPNLDWIIEEMNDAIQGVRDTDKTKNRSPERNGKGFDNFDVDKKRKRIIIKTWGTALNDGEKKAVPDNRCEMDWTTGEIYVTCKNNTYKLPVHLGAFEVDKNGYPVQKRGNNNMMVRAFTEVWNLMNMLKAHAVFNWKWAIEYQTFWSDFGGWAKWIHLNNGFGWWFTDTRLVSEETLNQLSTRYSNLWLKFDKQTKIQTASLLTAMKLDLWKIKWNPDIERVGLDPLDDEHKRWVKHYSKTYARSV